MSRPLAARRQGEIMRRLHSAEAVSVGELADDLRVSHETVRRDLKALAHQGQVTVVHGGAVRRQAAAAPVAQLVRENTKGRMAIGRAAAALLPEHSVVFLDSGPTTKSIAHALVARSGLTICTNSLCCALILAQQPGNRVFMLGGEVLRGEAATFGVETIGMLGNIRADLAFIEVAGFAEDGGATDDTFNGAELRGRMIAASRSYIVADARVVARRAPFRVPHSDKIAGIVVEEPPSPALAGAWAKAGIKVIVAR